jgi:hypothetical protein
VCDKQLFLNVLHRIHSPDPLRLHGRFVCLLAHELAGLRDYCNNLRDIQTKEHHMLNYYYNLKIKTQE